MNIKKVIIVFCSGLALTIIAIILINYLNLQRRVNQALAKDPRNKGIRVGVNYATFINPSRLIFDLRDIDDQKAPGDVFRCLLQTAEVLSSKDFHIVELQFKGTPKFLLKGDYFKTLGQKYSWQNPVYTTRTFTENVYNIDGTTAFSSWSGGFLGVLQEQMKDHIEFHKRWYIDDLSKK